MIDKKVLLSVPPGEPTKAWSISLMESAIYFWIIFLRHIRFKTITGISACYEFCAVSDRQWFPLLIPNRSEPFIACRASLPTSAPTRPQTHIQLRRRGAGVLLLNIHVKLPPEFLPPDVASGDHGIVNSLCARPTSASRRMTGFPVMPLAAKVRRTSSVERGFS